MIIKKQVIILLKIGYYFIKNNKENKGIHKALNFINTTNIKTKKLLY